MLQAEGGEQLGNAGPPVSDDIVLAAHGDDRACAAVC